MSTIRKELIPSVNEMMVWTREIFNQGIRRSGYPADYKVENWVKKQFQTLGLKDITLDPVPIKKWEFSNVKLKIRLISKPNKIFDIPCFPIPYTKPNNNPETELCLISDESEISNKILVSELELFKFPVKVIQSTYAGDRYYDPENVFANMEQIFPFDFKMRTLFDRQLKTEISGFIGILSGYPWETDEYYVPYDAVERNFPGVYVSPRNGKKILKLIEQGTVRGKISYNTKISTVISHNVTGTLKGGSDEWIVIGTHHDGPWNSAVEDASGMALVLAQAKYWSQIPREQRPFNLMFLMNCAHMAGGKGANAFAEHYKEFLKKVIAGIHLEHVARDVKSENGELIPMKDPTVRWWFVSRILPLEEIVESAIIKEDLKRSILLPPDGFPPGSKSPPTDGSFYHLKQVPFVSFLTAPPYLFDPADTLDKIHEESYEPLTRAVIRIINGLKNYTAEELRNRVLTKKQRKKRLKNKINE